MPGPVCWWLSSVTLEDGGSPEDAVRDLKQMTKYL